MEDKTPLPRSIKSVAIVLIVFGVICAIGFILGISMYIHTSNLKSQLGQGLFPGNSTMPIELKKNVMSLGSSFNDMFLWYAIMSAIASISLFVPGIFLLKKRVWARIWANVVLGIVIFFMSLKSISAIISFGSFGVLFSIFNLFWAGIAIWFLYILNNKNAKEYFRFLKELNN